MAIFKGEPLGSSLQSDNNATRGQNCNGRGSEPLRISLYVSLNTGSV